MRRILASIAALILAGVFVFLTLGASSGSSSSGTYRIELQNAFGLVGGEQFKVAGVPVGSISSIDLCEFDRAAHCQYKLDAVVTVTATKKGFNQFHADAFCQSRPQSLIGEYFLDCDPGTRGPVLPPGSTIPVSHTQSTIPADLVQNIMRLPYRERFTLIINELGAAVAARSMDIQSALRRADPALAQTDNLLALLANDSNTIKQLNVSANQVITALAVNNKQVQRFIVEANRASQASASPAANPASCGYSASAHCIEATWQKLPGFLEQLRPALAKLGAAADAQVPVFNNLNAAAGNLQRFFTDLVPFSHESIPSLRSLGQASAVGKPAVVAARPTVAALRRFTGPTGCDQQSKQILSCTPELAQNLAIVLQWLDSRKHAVEPDPRSPDGGVGYTGLEGVLEYVFNITNAVNTFTVWGHQLAVDAFASTVCSPYATPQTVANNLANYEATGGNPNTYSGQNPRSCYAWLGPNQQGVNQSDPSWTPQDKTPANPSPCVPDPGGYPVEPPGYGVHYYGPSTNACKLKSSNPVSSTTGGGLPGLPSVPGLPVPSPVPLPKPLARSAAKTNSGSSSGGGAANAASGVTNTTSSGANVGQAKQLLNYLLSS